MCDKCVEEKQKILCQLCKATKTIGEGLNKRISHAKHCILNPKT